MVSLRVFCYLLIFFVLQVHAKVSNANFNGQVTQAADSEGRGDRTSMLIADKASEDIMKSRKVLLKHVNVKVEAKKKNGLEIESKETVRKRNNKKKRLTKTVSLTADYSNPGHHPPRHN